MHLGILPVANLLAAKRRVANIHTVADAESALLSDRFKMGNHYAKWKSYFSAYLPFIL